MVRGGYTRGLNEARVYVIQKGDKRLFFLQLDDAQPIPGVKHGNDLQDGSWQQDKFLLGQGAELLDGDQRTCANVEHSAVTFAPEKLAALQHTHFIGGTSDGPPSDFFALFEIVLQIHFYSTLD